MKKEIIIIMVLAAILLSVITIARPGGILAGEEAYYHLSVASTQEKNSMTAIERPVFASEYDYLLGAAFLFFNPILFMKIFPIIIGAVCAVLFYLVSKRIIDKTSAFYASIIFILSPPFIYIFSANSAEMIPLFLLLLGAFLLVQEKRYLPYMAIAPFLIASLNSMFAAIMALVAYATYFLVKRDKKYFAASSCALVFLTLSWLRPNFAVSYSMSGLSPLSNLFSDLGGMMGVSVFTAIFFIVGLIVSKKREYAYPAIICLAISFLIAPVTLVYGNAVICAFAGAGLNNFIAKKWKLNNLKQTMNFLMIGGIVFSAASHVNVLKETGPSAGVIEAANWLNKNTGSGSVILSSFQNGLVIESVAGRKAVGDALFYNTADFGRLLNDSNEIFYSRTLEKTERLLNKYDISYIMIDDNMVNGGVWKNKNDGLLFLLTNQETFPTVYDSGGVRIVYYAK